MPKGINRNKKGEIIMENCQNHRHHHSSGKFVNAFLDVNGIPYLLGDYIDNVNFSQVDRSMIRSEISIDQSEAMRAVVNINVDDIGKRASDGLPAIVGNVTKQKDLLKMVSEQAERLGYQLDVIRDGIIIRINYQLENQATGQVTRSMSEDLRTTRRNLYLDINPRNVDDNAIITNFCDTLVSTVNQFTHGNERMILRITNIQMYYECLCRDRKVPRAGQSLYDYPGGLLPSTYGSEQDMYNYHHQMQHRHIMGYPDGWDGGYGYRDHCACPPTHMDFNRFYHFNDDGSDAILHLQEIYDKRCKTQLIAAGVINVNRAFVINPGHRIIFKISIWKNDFTLVNCTTSVAYALKERLYHNDCDYDHNYDGCNCHHHDHEITPDYETMIRLYHELQHTNDRQNCVINQLIIRMDDLTAKIDAITPVVPPVPPDEPSGGDQEPDIPPVVDPDEPSVEPEEPTNPDEPVVTPPEDNNGENSAVDL